MNISELVDELYGAFAENLGEPMRTHARSLPFTLKLADSTASWGRVFEHEIVLGAPALVAYAIPEVSGTLVRDAMLAHILSVIGAFGMARIEDDHVEPSASMLALLGDARRERDRAMGRLCGGRPYEDLNFAAAGTPSPLAQFDASGGCSYRSDRRRSTCTSAYRSRSGARAGSRRRGWRAPPAGTSADAARYGPCCNRWRLRCKRTKDVVEWDESLERGGSWAVCLMNANHPASSRTPRRPEGLESAQTRARVLRTGVLHTMLQRAVHHMRATRRRATVLGAQRLAAWVASRETRPFLAARRRRTRERRQDTLGALMHCKPGRERCSSDARETVEMRAGRRRGFGVPWGRQPRTEGVCSIARHATVSRRPTREPPPQCPHACTRRSIATLADDRVARGRTAIPFFGEHLQTGHLETQLGSHGRKRAQGGHFRSRTQCPALAGVRARGASPGKPGR